MSACPMCCNPCVQCCCPHFLPDKFPSIQYQSPWNASSSVDSQLFHNPPSVDKSFVFRQPKSEYSVLPRTDNGNSVISEQPRLHFTEVSPQNASESEVMSPASPDTLPTLEFSLYYDIQKNTLNVNLQQAYNLPTSSKGVECNTCVVVYLTPNKLEMFESQVVRKSSNPVYNQVFQFSNLSGPELLKKQTLVFRILEYSKSRDLIGIVTVHLADADLYGISTKMEIQKVPVADSAHDSSCGDILVSLMYKPSENSFQGVVLRVANLHGAELTGTRDPYVKVNLCHKGSCYSKWKTSVKKQSVNPVFNERFYFDISKLSLESITLEFIIMDHDRFSRDSVIGMVAVGADAPEDLSKAHWEEVVGSPNHAVSRWHKMTRQLYRPRSATL